MRKLAAGLGCRVESSRLYGKPLQPLSEGVTILDQILLTLRQLPVVEAVVLGIAEGEGNAPFVSLASRHGADYIRGDPVDVLGRLIRCAERAGGTDVFRMTTENPFLYFEALDEAWRRHVANGSDVTVVDGVPDGTDFEIYRLEALRVSHREGTAEHRSEMCSRFIKQHLDRFQVEALDTPPDCARPELRFSVDGPEDLIFCRAAYQSLRHLAPLIPLKELISFADAHPELAALVAPFRTKSLPWRPEAARR